NNVFMGADAVYVVLPIDMQAVDYTATQVAHATAIKNAVVNQGIKFVVTLSSVGAHLDKGTGVILGLHKLEELFNEIPNINVRNKRPIHQKENTSTKKQDIRSYMWTHESENKHHEFELIAEKLRCQGDYTFIHTLDIKPKSDQCLLLQHSISSGEI